MNSQTKNTKAWSAQWIPKLKDDMIETRATIAILVSVVLPEGVNRFSLVDGVWVSDPLSAIPLAAALRQQLVALDRERQSSVGKNEKMETALPLPRWHGVQAEDRRHQVLFTTHSSFMVAQSLPELLQALPC